MRNLLILFFLLFVKLVSSQQTIHESHPEYSAVHKTLSAYLDAIYNADSSLIAEIADSNLQKSGMYFIKSHQNWSYEVMNFEGLQHTAATYNSRGWIPKNAPHKIEVFEIGEKIAAGKVTAIWGYDYILLSRKDSVWRIDKVLWQSFTSRDITTMRLKRAYGEKNETKSLIVENQPDTKMFKGCFDGDSVLYYFIQRNNSYKIMKSQIVLGELRSAQPFMTGDPSTSRLYPTITPDGKYLLFTKNEKGIAQMASTIYQCKRTKKGWNAPEITKNVNLNGLYHSNLSFDSEGNFVFRVEDFKSDTSITYIAEYKNGKFEPPKPYLPVEQFKGQIKDLHLWGGVPGPNSNSVILDISLVGVSGKILPSDQWISYFKDKKWTTPLPIGNGVNKKTSWESFIFYNITRDTVYFIRDFNEIRYIATNKILN